MKLTVLGFWAVPTAGETSSFLLEAEGFKLLLDAGMNPSFTLGRAGVRLVDVSHVMLSHCHADHLSGFAGFVFSRQVQQRRFGPAPRLQVFGPAEALSAGRGLLELMYPDRQFEVEWLAVRPGESLTVGKAVLEFAATDHTVAGLALRIRGEERTFVYSSDTSSESQVVEFAKGADVLLGECFGTLEDFGPIAQQQKHLSAEQVGEMAATAGVCKLVLFHMHEPYKEAARRDALLQVVRAHFKGEVVFPREGEVIAF